MIIDWTYGAIAQLQGYFTTTIAINNSSIAPAVTGIIGCLTMVITSIAPRIAINSIAPSIEINSSAPRIKVSLRCENDT